MICRIFNCKEALVNDEKKIEDSYKYFAFDIEIVNNLIVENQNLRSLLEEVEPKVDCKFWRFYRYDDFMFYFFRSKIDEQSNILGF